MKTAIIVQARMTSTRLPGKVLQEIMGKPLLEYQIERLRRIESVDEIVIATTINASDQSIVDLCNKLAIPYYCGSEEDVLTRYYSAATAFGADIIVRITADCPLIDPFISDKAIAFFRKNRKEYDYVSLTGYPRGLDTEVFSFAVLEECWREATAQPEREHVTSYIYHHPERYRLERLYCSNEASRFQPLSLREQRDTPPASDTLNNDYRHHRWTVDTAEDFELIRRIIETLYPVKPDFTMKDILAVLKQYPEWIAINAAVRQKQYGE